MESDLLSLLRSNGILHAEPGQPLLDRRGEPAPWMFYSWNVALTSEGGRLAGRCLLDRLATFGSTQLATYGATAVPLLSACVHLSDGRYTGLCIRELPKGRGSGRQIEGPADRSRSVVLVDDSLSSGTSLLAGIRILEAHGFRVEGAVCLVHFPYRGGLERAAALGYRVETIFDIWDDLRMPIPAHTPGWRRVGTVPWSDDCLDEDLAAPEAARRVADRFLDDGTVLRPPDALLPHAGGEGGVWISFRDRASDVRVARDGFWHFDPSDAVPARDLVLATFKTLRAGRVTPEHLPQIKIGVTFFGALEPILPSGLDFARHGIVVRSRAWPVKVGGALPNTQVFTSESEQYGLARRNASLGRFEPHDLYRHTVHKQVETGSTWLPYGAEDGPAYAWTSDDAVGAQLTRRAHDVLRAVAVGAVPDLAGAIADPTGGLVEGVAVTLYRNGVMGCCVAGRGTLDDCLVSATTGAARDERFKQNRPSAEAWNDVAVSVSILFDQERLGRTTTERAARKLRLGLDSFAAYQGDRSALLLAAVAPHFDWSKEQLGSELLRKAGISGDPVSWSTYRTATWIDGSDGFARQAFGFGVPPPADGGDGWIRGDIDLLAGHIAANIDPSTGRPIYGHSPMDGRRWPRGSSARIIHAMEALHLAGCDRGRATWTHAGREGVRSCLAHVVDHPDGGLTLTLPDQRGGPMADCELLHALNVVGLVDEARDVAHGLAERVGRLVQPDGSITPTPNGVRADADHDFLPGAVLASLAEHGLRAQSTSAPVDLTGSLAWYRRRFDCRQPWGLAAWQMQAFSAVHRLTGERDAADGVFAMADWAMDRQLEVNGAFLTDLSPGGPSFHTAFVAEGLADAWRLAAQVGEDERAERYGRSWREAVRFVRRLVIRAVDTPMLPDPHRGVGGVRGTLDSSIVRIDYVSHALIALCKGAAAR